MNFSLTKDLNAIPSTVEEICSPSDDAYWTQKDKVDVFPEFFSSTLALDGWLRFATPLEYDATGLGHAALRCAPKCAVFCACETAVLTQSGIGYVEEYQVERYLRESMVSRTATIVPQLIPSFIAEKVLGLPKSY